MIILVETVHGVLRTALLAPLVGDFPARQIGVFIGSLLILTIAYLSIRWIRAYTNAQLIAVGLMWLALTVLFEFDLGLFVLGLSWERMASDYDLRRGGLLPLGLVVLMLSPLIAAKLRGLQAGEIRRKR